VKKLITSITLTTALLSAISPVCAYEQGDWIVRGGHTSIAPDDSSSHVIVGTADLGVGVNVNTNIQLGLN
jgi:outer membrane protein